MKTMKLCQIVALANGMKGRTQKAITAAYHKIQKPDLITGISRRYRPKDEEGDELPPESKQVNYRVRDAIGEVEKAMAELIDIVATQDIGNTEAKAAIQLGENAIDDIPVTHLLFLEKQLVDVGTFISKLPTLDTSEAWHFSEEADCYATEVDQKTRTKKTPRNHVKAEATEQHPAQVEVYMEDVIVGTWDTTKFSGAIPQKEKTAMQERLTRLIDAVKMARQEANSDDVEPVAVGKEIMQYIFGTNSASSG